MEAQTSDPGPVTWIVVPSFWLITSTRCFPSLLTSESRAQEAFSQRRRRRGRGRQKMVKVSTYFLMSLGAFAFWQSMDKLHVWIALHQDEKVIDHPPKSISATFIIFIIGFWFI
ncbi:unnamed protein product [Linum trigynum]|uniref:Uncharacterized protein n=1 Tax=Linum trigynum TaxID=586398 RepID=A0AAV2EXS8_9ROSI